MRPQQRMKDFEPTGGECVAARALTCLGVRNVEPTCGLKAFTSEILTRKAWSPLAANEWPQGPLT